ncbi:MAG: diguanylate cyclase [Halothiobacillaceae bacterium]
MPRKIQARMTFRAVVTSLALLVTLVFIVVGRDTWLSMEGEHQAELSREAREQRAQFESSLDGLERQMLALAALVANDRDVRALFHEARQTLDREGGGAGGAQTDRIREDLMAQVADSWRQMQQDFGLRQLHFHFGPGALSFLRVHHPERYGDRLDGLRHIIEDVNRDQQPRSGFELGRVYSGVRGIVPVWHERPDEGRTYVGALEAGAALDELLLRLDQLTGAGVAVLLDAGHVEDAIWNDLLRQTGMPMLHDCGCFLESSSRADAAQWVTRALSNGRPKDALSSTTLQWAGRHWQLLHFPLRDYLGTQEPQREPVGYVLMWRDITGTVNTLHERQSRLIVFLATAFLLVQVLLIGGALGLRRVMQQRVDSATDALRENQRRLARAQEVALLGTWELDIASGRLNWSEATHHIYGIPPEEPVDYERFMQRVHPDDRDLVDSAWNQALENQPYDIEHRIIVNGWVRWVREIAEFTLDSEGRVLRALGTVQDITELKQVELALRESEARYRDTLAAVQDGMWEWNIRTDEIHWDERSYAMLGHPPNAFELDFQTWQTLLHPEDRDAATTAMRAQLEGGETFRIEFRMRRADGSWQWLMGRGRVIEWQDNQPYRVMGTHTNISRRKEAELALRRASSRNALLLASANEGIFGIDGDGHITFMNPAALSLLDYEEAELDRKTATHQFLCAPDDPIGPARPCPFAQTLADGQARRVEDLWFRRRDGSCFPVTLSIAPVEEPGEPRGLVVMFQDVTERMLAEEALRDARTRLALVIENFHAGVLLETEDRHIELTNQNFCDLFQIPVPPRGLIGTDCSNSAEQVKHLFAHPEQFVQRIGQLLAQQMPAVNEELTMADGRTLERDYLPIIRGDHLLGNLWIYRDISERKQRESLLHRLATTDTMTETANRRHFLERLEEELSRYQRHLRPVVVLMIDIDHFKKVNDTYGHAAGDAVLRHFTGMVRELKRKVDLLGRLGGEEFALMLPDARPEGGLQFAERLRQAIQSRPAVHEDRRIEITVSIGLTEFSIDDQSGEQALIRADRALYRAKRAGRNQIQAQWPDQDEPAEGHEHPPSPSPPA